MGLIKAAEGGITGNLADQWLEFFTLDSMPTNVLVTKGKKVIGNRGTNVKGSENIISDGSGIVVADGQAVALINNGLIVEFAAEPGMYTFDASTAPSIFANTGGFGENLMESFKDMIERFKRAGGVYQDQRVYYFNVKEILGNKYGTAEPIAYRVVDTSIGLDMDVDLRCNGEFSYKLTNPILFYQNVAGNVSGDYTRDMIDSQLKSELLTSLNSALSRVSAKGIRYSALPGYAPEIADDINEILSNKWRNLRGIEVVSFAVNSVSITDEDEKRIKDMQALKSLRDPSMAGAALVAAQADAMRSAAENEGGAAIGFLGMGLASQAGGTSAAASDLLTRGGANPANQPMAYPSAADGGYVGVAAVPTGTAPFNLSQAAPPIPGTEIPAAVGAAAVASTIIPGETPFQPPIAPVAPIPDVPPAPASSAFVPAAATITEAAPGFPSAPEIPAPVPVAAPIPIPAPAPLAASAAVWICPNCGQADNAGNFCANCGTPRPAPTTWDCPTCGQTGNLGNFCANCGTPKP
ncbi:MAG: SPFH domain-containing protein [Coriobacteriales bacterium]|jgi:membrane protease subunit (stomatin/prohibitin family)|nr:SPFH domain-containing protein [Coriobacteriales bacterium]